MRSTQVLPAANRLDPWAHRYVDGDSSYQSSPGGDEDEYLHNQPPPLSPKRASYDPALGFGMPSRISRDLRTSAALKYDLAGAIALEPALEPSSNDLISLKPAPASTDAASRRVSQDYSAPVVKGSDGALSKVCGSLVEPSESRNRWACADCATVFARDSTLYAAPTSLQSHDSSYYCRDCYAKRYSIGTCRACGRDVIGSTKEDGKFVKASAGIWHGRCWKCVTCSKGARDGAEILVGMDGNPTCEGCFDRPRRAPSAEPPTAASSRENLDLPDVRRLTRVVASRNGPMVATIAELTKRLGQHTVSSSPQIPFSSRSNSTTSLPKSSSSSSNSLDMPRSPSKSQYAFPNHVATSTWKDSSMTRSGSLTGSPPKPRPLTAQFRDGLNLAAFKPSFPCETEDERLSRRDSRSRSVSPAKRPDGKAARAPSKLQAFQVSGRSDAQNDMSTSPALEADKALTRAASKVPGSPSLAPVSPASAQQNVGAAAPEPGRRRTSSGFPRPLNSPFSKKASQSEPLQGEKSTESPERDACNGSNPSTLEPAEGSVRCTACRLLPFERMGSSKEQEVVMVTLPEQIHLHAECFQCSVCRGTIDGSKMFVRLQDDAAYPPLAEGLAAYAHPHCSPAIQLKAVRTQDSASNGDVHQRSYRSSLDPASTLAMTRDGNTGSHATHQRELKPSSTPSSATSVRDRSPNSRPSILPEQTIGNSNSMQQSTLQNSNGSTAPSMNSDRMPTGSVAAEGPTRRSQPTAGVAPTARSPIMASTTAGRLTASRAANPAAGIFSRMSALSTASGSPLLTSTTSISDQNGIVARPRFGGMQCCAFCGEKLSSLESVLGPRGTQWHKACLICRGPPPPKPKDTFVSYRKQAPVICGKKLDSGAKVNKEGEVRCRDCYDRESSAFRINA